MSAYRHDTQTRFLAVMVENGGKEDWKFAMDMSPPAYDAVTNVILIAYEFAGATRTIAIAAYQQAFEQYDMSYASAIAVVMGLCQLAALIVIILLRRRLSPAATMGVGKR